MNRERLYHALDACAHGNVHQLRRVVYVFTARLVIVPVERAHIHYTLLHCVGTQIVRFARNRRVIYSERRGS